MNAGANSESSLSPQIQLITPFLWFDTQGEEAANFYCSIFPNSKITKIAHYGDAGPGRAGSVMTVEFLLNGQEFVALNGGPHFKFTEAISLAVNVRTQDEIDYYWSKLTSGGEEVQCGWLKDKYGLSWQVNPIILGDYFSDPDPTKANRVMKAMLGMVKMDLQKLKDAYAGK